MTTDPAPGTPEEETGGAPEEETGAPDEQPMVTFMGEQFRLSDRIGSYSILKFQRYANTADPRAMEAVHAILEDAIHPDDWRRFEDLAISGKADDDELLAVIYAAARQLMLQVARKEQLRRAIPQDHRQPRRQQPRRRR